MLRQVEDIMDKLIRPSLAQHGGNVEIVDIDNYIVFVRFFGGCQGCSSSKATLQGGIERILKQHFPEIEGVVDVTDHASGENPYM